MNICFVTDNKYIYPTLVAINSIKQSNYNMDLNIYVICDNVSKNNLTLLSKFESKNCKIRIINGNNPYTKCNYVHKYVTKTALLKFLIPEILNTIDKVLYLDSDVIVKKTLNVLYNTDISNVYAAVVFDMLAENDGHARKMNLDNYFNSGVMLLNLKKMREDNIQEKLSICKSEQSCDDFMDQDCFNFVFAQNICSISPIYNFMKYNLKKFSIDKIAQYYKLSQSDANNLQSDSVILHFSNKNKPWESIFKSCFKDYIKYMFGKNFIDLTINKLSKIIIEAIIGSFKRIIKYILELLFRIIYPNHIYINFLTDLILAPRKTGIAKDKEKKGIIVSLTSYPQRINEVHYSIYSLLKQSIKPDKVILWLAESEFSEKEKSLPKKLLNLQKCGLSIEWCEDIKSFKKLIPALKKYPENIIVTADDDIYYSKNWLKNIYESYLKNPGCIHANRAHLVNIRNNVIMPYGTWNKETDISEPSFKIFCTTGGGVLFPPHSLFDKVCDRALFESIAPTADDIWFWGMAVLNNTKIITINKMLPLCYINIKRELNNKKETLGSTNVCADGNDNQLTKLIEKFPLIKTKLVQEDIVLNHSKKMVLIKTNNIILNIGNKYYKLKRN